MGRLVVSAPFPFQVRTGSQVIGNPDLARRARRFRDRPAPRCGHRVSVGTTIPSRKPGSAVVVDWRRQLLLGDRRERGSDRFYGHCSSRIRIDCHATTSAIPFQWSLQEWDARSIDSTRTNKGEFVSHRWTVPQCSGRPVTSEDRTFPLIPKRCVFAEYRCRESGLRRRRPRRMLHRKRSISRWATR